MVDSPPTLAPFKHAMYRLVWSASIVSNFGTLIQTVGAAWLMTLIAQSADMVALVQASVALPVMLFSLVAGAIADSYDRRKVMLTAQILMFLISILLAVTVYGGWITPWLLLTFTFLLGAGMALYNPSWQASLGDLVPRSDLPAAIALNSIAFNAARSVGPALGGAIVATAGAAAAFVLNAVSYIPLIIVLWRWKPPVMSKSLPREPLGTAIRAGMRYVSMSPNIEKVLMRAFIFGMVAIAVVALLPLVARDMLGGDAVLYGVLFGAYGLGAIIGGTTSARMRRAMSSELIVRLCFVGSAVSAAVVAFSPFAWLTFFAMMLAGACWLVSLSLFNTTVQLFTPRWVVGRAISLYHMAAFGGISLGSWVWGLVAAEWGPPTALLLASVAALLSVASGIGRMKLPELTSLNLDPLNRWTEPRLELDLAPRSGPVKIMIEYIIAEKDTSSFLEHMVERRRIRRRDGARHWSLLRDLEHPELWVEAYHLPTWLDYVRYNHRMTHEDALIGDQIRGLHSGEEPPRVRRMIERPAGLRAADPHPKGMRDLHQ